MKVFFTASHRGKTYFDEYYIKIYELIEQFNFQNLDDSLITIPIKKFYSELDKLGKQRDIKLYNRNLEYIKKADINIFECSFQSISIGFMIEKSLELNKPTVVLYLEGNIPHFLAGAVGEKLIIRSYKKNNIKDVIKATLVEAKSRGDKRFNFFISPKLLSYLEKASKERNITKSTFIRNLILDHMNKFTGNAPQ